MGSEYASSLARIVPEDGAGAEQAIPRFPPLFELALGPEDPGDGESQSRQESREMCGKMEQANRIPEKYDSPDEYLWQMQCHMAVEYQRSMESSLTELHTSPEPEPGQEKAWFSFEVVEVDPKDTCMARVYLTDTEPRNLRRLCQEFDSPKEEIQDNPWWAGWMMEMEGHGEVVLAMGGAGGSSWKSRELLLYFPSTRPTSLDDGTSVRLRLVEYVKGTVQHYEATQSLRVQLEEGSMNGRVKDLLHQVVNPTLREPGQTAQAEGLVEPTSLGANPGTAAGIVSGLQGGLQAIQGPPGTGKSTTIKTIIKDRIPPLSKTIVACTKNKAVDAVVGKLVSLPGGVVVFGNEKRLGPEAKLYRLEEQVQQHKFLVRWRGISDQLDDLTQKIEDSVAAALDWCISPSSLLRILSTISGNFSEEEKRQMAFQKVLSMVGRGSLDIQVIADLIVEDVQLQDQATLVGLIHKVFDRATEEQGPAELCARLCKSISTHPLVPRFRGGFDDTDICSVLLDKCEGELHGTPVGRYAATVFQKSPTAVQHPCSPEQLAPSDVQGAAAKVKFHRSQLEAQAAVRQRNAAPSRPSYKDLVSLDKSVRGNQKLVSRLRAGGPVLQVPASAGDDDASAPAHAPLPGTVSGTNGVAALLAAFKKVNQEKFLGDLASALLDAPKSESEVAGALEVAAFLHQRYEEFAVILMEKIMHAYKTCKPSSGKEHQLLRHKQQFCVRLAAEGAVLGIFGAPHIRQIRDMVKDAASEKNFIGVSNEEAITSASALALLIKPPVREAFFGFPFSSLDLPVPLSMLQEEAPVWQLPTGVAEGLVALHTELQALKEAQEQQWKLPEQEASELSKVK